MGPGALPRHVVSRLHGEVTRLIQVPDVRQRLTSLGIDLIGNTPEEFSRTMQTDLEKFGKLVRASGAKID